jgi:hypothetical protein
VRRLAAEEQKQKKDAEKARAREKMRARGDLEKRHRIQEREGLPREASPDSPDEDDDDDDDDEGMAARLGFSPELRLQPGPSSAGALDQPSGGLEPLVPGSEASGPWPEEQMVTEGVLDPSAMAGGVMSGQIIPPAPRTSEAGVVVPSEQVVDPSAEAGGATSGQATPLAPHTFETEVALKQIADQPSAPSVGSKGPRGFAPKKKIVPWSG